MINYALSLIPLFLIMIVTGVPIRISVLSIPLILLILGGFTLGIGLMLSSIVTVFPDISEMYRVFLTAWMYLTPVIVPEDTLAKILNGWVLKANPVYHILRLMRMVIYDGVFPTGHQWLVAIVIALATLLFGWHIFTKRADTYGYKI
jgi:ABC-2 type transport system permease protein